MFDELEKHKEEQRKRRGFTESYYSAIKSRLNLQRIGSYIREGSGESTVDYSSFDDREKSAFSEIETYLNKKYGEESATDILEHMTAYGNAIEQISFSLGMKVGATMLCKLIDNFETDI